MNNGLNTVHIARFCCAYCSPAQQSLFKQGNERVKAQGNDHQGEKNHKYKICLKLVAGRDQQKAKTVALRLHEFAHQGADHRQRRTYL